MTFFLILIRLLSESMEISSDVVCSDTVARVRE
jgi:hypothetical protein